MSTLHSLHSLEREGRKIIEHLQEELQKIRTGRAQTSLVASIMVNAYGTATALEGLAAINVPEPRVITIAPWDKGVIKDIEKAISDSSLGLNAVNDGDMLRITIPELTEERRAELVKVVNEKAENARIALRTVRESLMKDIKASQKSGDISEDDAVRNQERLQKEIQKLQEDIEKRRKEKEDELLTI